MYEGLKDKFVWPGKRSSEGNKELLDDTWKKKESKGKGDCNESRGDEGEFRVVQLKLLPENGTKISLFPYYFGYFLAKIILSLHVQQSVMLAGEQCGLSPFVHSCCPHCGTGVMPTHRGEVWD